MALAVLMNGQEHGKHAVAQDFYLFLFPDRLTASLSLFGVCLVAGTSYQFGGSHVWLFICWNDKLGALWSCQLKRSILLIIVCLPACHCEIIAESPLVWVSIEVNVNNFISWILLHF